MIRADNLGYFLTWMWLKCFRFKRKFSFKYTNKVFLYAAQTTKRWFQLEPASIKSVINVRNDEYTHTDDVNSMNNFKITINFAQFSALPEASELQQSSATWSALECCTFYIFGFYHTSI